jgi:DnaJ-like protein
MDDLQRAFAILGLPPGASQAQVRRAYRELVRVWHPDRFTDDPRLQLSAQERLKQINEAYRLIRAELAARPHRQQEPREAEPAPSRPAAPKPVVTSFLSFWPNLLFLIFAVGLFRFATLRYGLSLAALAYLLQMATVPAAFALACNSRLGEKRSLWVAYVVAVVLFGAIVGLEALSYKKELQESGGNSYPAAVEPAGGELPGGTITGVEPREPLEAPLRPPPTGPAAPATPRVPVPAPPTPPATPLVPHSR